MSRIETLSRFADVPVGRAESGSDVLVDYYRCGAKLWPLSISPNLTSHPGYFRLGADTVCYGRLASGAVARHPDDHLEDVLGRLRGNSSGLPLPFDSSELIDNLRRERYSSHFLDPGRSANELLRKTYYLLRPLLGVRARRRLQKFHLRGWEKISFPSWPVDMTVDRIHRKLLALAMRAQGIETVPFIWFWPDGAQSCAIITHDVEGPAGRDFCLALMDLDQSFGFTSAFQIIPEERYLVSQEFLASIRNRGFEVNVHDLTHDGQLYADREEFLRRAKRINKYIREYEAQGFRSGILYRNADWYEAFDFSYDMSVPNVGHLDAQRGGCCTVMPYFIGSIVELPVTCTQDYTLFHILDDYSIDLWKKQIGMVRETFGLINFIVHPDYVQPRCAQDSYRELLSYLARMRHDDHLWTPLPGEVAAWWRRRNRMELVEDGGKWRVEGEGSERARVAYASISGDEVTYSLP